MLQAYSTYAKRLYPFQAPVHYLGILYQKFRTEQPYASWAFISVPI